LPAFDLLSGSACLAPDDISGSSVSNAGDVNGDGLDDLIVGAKHADPDSKSKAGKSYISHR
jgi:hypothetical protein